MQRLNAPKNAAGDEVTPGVKWLTLRSDNNDKYAQPDGVWIGAKGTPTNIGFDGPALQGRDQRGAAARRPPRDVVLAGGLRCDLALPDRRGAAHAAAGGRIDDRAVGQGHRPRARSARSGQRRLRQQPAARRRAGSRSSRSMPRPARAAAPPPGSRRSAPDGRWGPFNAQPATAYEFELSAPGYATTHIYRSPFPRSSDSRAAAARTHRRGRPRRPGAGASSRGRAATSTPSATPCASTARPRCPACRRRAPACRARSSSSRATRRARVRGRVQRRARDRPDLAGGAGRRQRAGTDLLRSPGG